MSRSSTGTKHVQGTVGEVGPYVVHEAESDKHRGQGEKQGQNLQS